MVEITAVSATFSLEVITVHLLSEASIRTVWPRIKQYSTGVLTTYSLDLALIKFFVFPK
jgi:hypothetical protein